MSRHMKLQSEIGWNLVFCGLIDENWSDAQEKFFSRQPDRHCDNTGLVWNVNLCKWIIRESRQVWLNRNQEVHQPDEGNSKAEQEIFAQVQHLYELQDEISQQDRRILDEPMEEKLNRPISVLRQWVRNTVPVLNRCIHDYQNKLHTGQRDIRQYFQRVPPKPPYHPAPNNPNPNAT